jgi:hypothetical protein
MTSNLPATITVYHNAASYTITVSALTIAVSQDDGDTVTFEKAMYPHVWDGRRWFIDGIVYVIVDYLRFE